MRDTEGFGKSKYRGPQQLWGRTLWAGSCWTGTHLAHDVWPLAGRLQERVVFLGPINRDIFRRGGQKPTALIGECVAAMQSADGGCSDVLMVVYNLHFRCCFGFWSALGMVLDLPWTYIIHRFPWSIWKGSMVQIIWENSQFRKNHLDFES